MILKKSMIRSFNPNFFKQHILHKYIFKSDNCISVTFLTIPLYYLIMKKAVFWLITLILLVIPVKAETITQEMNILDTVVIDNQTVTLLDLETKKDKIVVCVNNEKNIVAKNKPKIVNNVRFEVRKVDNNIAKIKMKSKFKKCVAKDNKECLHKCNTDTDCDNEDGTTIDECTGIPRECKYSTRPVEKKELIPEDIEVNVTLQPPRKEEKPAGIVANLLDWINKRLSKTI